MWKGTLDTLQNCPYLSGETKNAITEFIQKNDMKTLPCGKYPLNDTDFVNVVSVQTKESDGVFEAHKKYVDVFYMITGDERVDYSETVDEMTKDYVEADDYFLCTAKNIDSTYSREKEFCVLDTEELHKPSVCIEQPTQIKKAIFKICKNPTK
ncbi:MAG: DUF386 domain-containing protein [Clostridiales bacterium]|nr:DUF386 domain-containing protein [Clostridiales bacterium]